jgi:hypothetical protein
VKKTGNHIFTGQEVALAYALCAECLFGQGEDFLNENPMVMPIFVSHLFQSLEISIKHAGTESGLFTMQEARNTQKGHGINELATLAIGKLGGKGSDLVMALTCFSPEDVRSSTIIAKMIYGKEFDTTRRCYCSRRLGYAEVENGEFRILDPIQEWVAAVKQTAINLNSTIEILTQWMASSSNSKHFAIWFTNH